LGEALDRVKVYLMKKIMAGSSGFAFAQNVNYKVQSGDTFWKIGQKYNISTSRPFKGKQC